MSYTTSKTPSLDPNQFTRHQELGGVGTAQLRNEDLEATDALTRLGATVVWLSILASVGVVALGLHILMESLVAIFHDTDILATASLGTAFFAGMVATLLLQSSTMVSVVLVTSVGTGTLPVDVALMAIFGANLATTATPLVFSFVFARQREHFLRAMRVAWMHVWFNALGIITMAPIELMFHPLRNIALELTQPLPRIDSVVTPQLWSAFDIFARENPETAAITACAGAAIVGAGMHLVAWRVRVLTGGTGFPILERSGGLKDAIGIGVGAVGTMAAGASSILVSAVAAITSTRGMATSSALPLILGANIGTTLTSIVTAMSMQGQMGVISLQVAIVHVLFNLTGTLLVLLISPLRRLIIKMASWTASVSTRSMIVAIIIMVMIFAAIPAGLMVL